jgi:hypothetical protein
MLRVPPASIRAIGEYGTELNKRRVPVEAAVTRIGFDMESPTPLLTFRAVGFLDADSYKAAVEAAKSDIVQNILGGVAHTETADNEAVEKPAAEAIAKAKAEPEVPKIATKAKTVTEAEVVAAVALAEAPAKKAKTTVVEVGDLEVGGFDDLEFD